MKKILISLISVTLLVSASAAMAAVSPGEGDVAGDVTIINHGAPQAVQLVCANGTTVNYGNQQEAHATKSDLKACQNENILPKGVSECAPLDGGGLEPTYHEDGKPIYFQIDLQASAGEQCQYFTN